LVDKFLSQGAVDSLALCFVAYFWGWGLVA